MLNNEFEFDFRFAHTMPKYLLENYRDVTFLQKVVNNRLPLDLLIHTQNEESLKEQRLLRSKSM
jgi:hypothetical protein